MKNLLLLPWILRLIVDMVNDSTPFYRDHTALITFVSEVHSFSPASSLQAFKVRLTSSFLQAGRGLNNYVTGLLILSDIIYINATWWKLKLDSSQGSKRYVHDYPGLIISAVWMYYPSLSKRGFPENWYLSYNELSQKTRFQSLWIAALCLYNTYSVKTWFSKNLSVPVHSGIDR